MKAPGAFPMRTMLAARLRKYGGAKAIKVELTSLADPGSGKLLVRIHAAVVNAIDWKIRSGLLQQKMPLQFPATLGAEIAIDYKTQYFEDLGHSLDAVFDTVGGATYSHRFQV